MCEGPLLLRDEANHRCICTELSHIFAHVFCLKRILHLFISTSLINSSLDRNERCSTCCMLLETQNYCFFYLVPAGGKTQWSRFNSPNPVTPRAILRLHRPSTSFQGLLSIPSAYLTIQPKRVYGKNLFIVLCIQGCVLVNASCLPSAMEIDSSVTLKSDAVAQRPCPASSLKWLPIQSRIALILLSSTPVCTLID